MKMFLKFILSAVLILAILPISTFASTEVTDNENIIHFEDGSYITIELISVDTRTSGTKTGSKTYCYKNSDGVEEWRAILTGTFTYNGSSATCTATNCNVTITNTNWYTVSKTVSKSGASALGDLVMGRKWLGITVEKENFKMQITCSPNGTLS